MLGSSSKTAHFRKVKRTVYGIDIALGAIMVVAVSYFYGIQAKPLYIPLDSILLTVGLIELMVFSESMAFKFMELKYSDSASAKLFIVCRINKRAVVALVVALMVSFTLIMPGVLAAAEDSTSTRWEGTMIDEDNNVSVTLGSRDALGMSWVSQISVSARVVEGSSLRYTLYSVADGAPPKVIYSENVASGSNVTRDIPIAYREGYHEYILNFTKTDNATTAVVGYSTDTRISGIYGLYIPLLGFVFIFSSVPVIAAVYVRKKRYIMDSIYESV